MDHAPGWAAEALQHEAEIGGRWLVAPDLLRSDDRREWRAELPRAPREQVVVDVGEDHQAEMPPKVGERFDGVRKGGQSASDSTRAARSSEVGAKPEALAEAVHRPQ